MKVKIVVISGLLYALGAGLPALQADELKREGGESKCQSELSRAQRCHDTKDDGQTSGSDAGGEAPGAVSRLFRAWSHMADRVQAAEPDWLSPLITTSGRLKNEIRYDVWQQASAGGETDYTLASGKGLEFIVAPRLQLMVAPPPYVVHTRNGQGDGFGDTPVMAKLRIVSAPYREGDYLVTLLLGATIPSGSHALGTHEAVLSPGIALGKGWRKFDIQSALSANLPLRNTVGLGRQLQSNTAFQYRAAWRLWPELEVNTTSYFLGKNAGGTQAFLTPGMGFGRARLAGRFRFSAAAGMQIAVTQFHTYDHRWIYSVRFSF